VIAALVAGLAAGYGVAVPVGAIAALVISLTARTSFRVGAAAAMGVATADGVFAVAAVLGGAALAPLIQPIATPLRWLAAALLIVIATRTALTAVRHHRELGTVRSEAGLTTPGRAYLGLLGLTLLNPTTIVYFGALVLGRQSSDELGLAGQTVFVAAAFAASASWQLLIAGGGSLVGRVLTGPRGRLVTALVSSVVIVALAVALILPLRWYSHEATAPGFTRNCVRTHDTPQLSGSSEWRILAPPHHGPGHRDHGTGPGSWTGPRKARCPVRRTLRQRNAGLPMST
jgi:arginine exporter protein ArgO